MFDTRISLGVAFLSKQLSSHVSAKAIIHAELVTATGRYLLSRITYQYNSELLLNAKTKEIECENIVDVLQRLAKAVAHKIESGYVFDTSALETLSEEDETWGSFELGASGSSYDPELDTQFEPATLDLVTLNVAPRRTIKRSALASGSQRKSVLPDKLRNLRRHHIGRTGVSSVRVR